MRKYLPFLLFLTFFFASQAQAAYTYTRSITVTSTVVVASGTLTNFPMLVSSTISSWATISNGGRINNLVSVGGLSIPADLIFATSTANCNGTPLNFETESYTSSTGAIVDWVNIPSLSAGSVIYACYGDATVTTDQSHPSSTWDSNFKEVFHMSDNITGSSGTIKDSTVTNYSLTAGGNGCCGTSPNIATTTAKINNGVNFINSNQYQGSEASGTANSGVGTSTTFTLEAWANTANNGGFDVGYNSFASVVGVTDSNSFGLITDNGAANFAFTLQDGGNVATSTGFVVGATGTWEHVVGTYDGTTLKTYVNGILGTSTAFTMGTAKNGDGKINMAYTISCTLGCRTTNVKLDEVRVSNTTRNSSWILTEYNNQSNPSTFYAVGSETGGTPVSGEGNIITYLRNIIIRGITIF